VKFLSSTLKVLHMMTRHDSSSRSDTIPPVTHGSAETIANLMRTWPHFRGKARLQDWLVPHSGVKRATVFGCKMDLDLSDVIQRDVYAGMYEPFEARGIKELLRPGMTVADVGANIGYYTWLSSSVVGPTGRVLAFEPGPYAYERLQRVIQENGIGNVDCHNVALSDTSGRGTLYVPKRAVGNYNPSLSPYLPDMDPVEVSVETLDNVLDRLRVGRIDLMKVDVEGHELEVFRGAERAIRERRIGAILSEFNQGYQEGAGWSCGQLERWFGENGFRLAEVFPSKWGSPVHNRLYVARS
jgi:FkbM family methyltransferase